jgi:hypothetical protein
VLPQIAADLAMKMVAVLRLVNKALGATLKEYYLNSTASSVQTLQRFWR